MEKKQQAYYVHIIGSDSSVKKKVYCKNDRERFDTTKLLEQELSNGDRIKILRTDE